VTCLAADDGTLELATGKLDGSITLWDTQTWTIKAVLHSATGGVSSIRYGSVKGSKLPKTFILVSSSCVQMVSIEEVGNVYLVSSKGVLNSRNTYPPHALCCMRTNDLAMCL